MFNFCDSVDSSKIRSPGVSFKAIEFIAFPPCAKNLFVFPLLGNKAKHPAAYRD